MLEIILVAIAWSKGWKWRALIPIMISWTIVFTLAASMGENAIAPIIIVAICELVALGIMASTQPASAYKQKLDDIKTNSELEQPSSTDVIETEEHSLIHN